MKCNRCEIEKSPDDFYSSDRSCKECRRALVKASRLAKADYYREYDRKRASLEHRVRMNRVVSAEWRKLHPERRRAQVALSNAVRDGKVQKWPACAVPDCTNTRVVGHHPDYSRHLEVVWLCQAHHKQAHALGDTLKESLL